MVRASFFHSSTGVLRFGAVGVSSRVLYIYGTRMGGGDETMGMGGGSFPEGLEQILE